MSPSTLRPLVLLLALFTSLGAWGKSPQRVISLELQRDPSITRTQALRLRQAVNLALQEATFEVLNPRTTDRYFKAQSACVSVECLGRASSRLGAHYVVGGRVGRVVNASAEDWTVALWIFDARSRSTVATAQGGCERCGLHQALEAIKNAVDVLLGDAREGGTSARLNIHSTPAGAAVSINGRPMGVTDMSFGVLPGQQEVILKRSGYQPHMVTVELHPGEEITIKAELKALLSPSSAPVTERGDHHAKLFNRLKWILAGGAAAVLPLGVIFLAQGKENSTRDDQQREQTTIHNYTPVGIALTATGATLAVGAVISLVLERRALEARRLKPRVDAGARGFTVNIGGRF